MSKMTGGKQLAANFRTLAQALGRPMNEASRKALQPMLRAAKANVRKNDNVQSGKFLKSLTVKRDPTSKKDAPVHMIGPGSKEPHSRLGHLLEFGVAPHDIDGAPHPGARAFPWLGPAFEEKSGEAIEIFGKEIGPALEKHAARLGASTKK